MLTIEVSNFPLSVPRYLTTKPEAVDYPLLYLRLMRSLGPFTFKPSPVFPPKTGILPNFHQIKEGHQMGRVSFDQTHF